MPIENLEAAARVERGPAIPEVITNPERRVLFVPGVTATDMRNRAYKNAFTKRYPGNNNVMVKNSIVSADKRNRGRFRDMQDFITGADGQAGIDIGVHSLGSAEVAEVIGRIQEENPGFWENQPNKDTFNFVLIDPSGFNITDEQRKEYRRSAVRIMREHGNFGIFSRKRTIVRGIDSLIAFPPEGLTPDEVQSLIAGVRAITPSLSTPEERDGLPVIGFQHGRDTSGYKEPYVSVKGREKASELDRRLQQTLSDGDLSALEHIVRERGEIFKHAIDRIYESRLEEPLDATEGGLLKLLLSMGRRDARRMLRSALGSGPMKKFKELYDMGYKNITLVSTEHSVAVPLGNLLQMFDSEEQRTAHVQIMEFETHPGPSIQPERTAEIIWNLGQNRAGDILPS